MKWVTSLLTWGVTLVIARLLTPDEYGLFGMAMVFIGFAQLASEAGLVATIVQAPELDESYAARLGGLALMLAVAIAAFSVGISSLLAVFFREPAVQMIVMALSLMFILRGVQVLRRGLITRALRFHQIAWIDAAEAVMTSLATLGYALLGWGYWALVGGALTGLATGTVLSVVLYPHRIELPRHINEFSGSIRFGAHVFGGQVAWYAYTAADFVVVGRMLGATALGAYTFAWVIAGIAVERLAAMTGRVVPAVFAAVQQDKAALRRYVYRLTEGLALVTMPACIGIALVADLIVVVGLGEAWVAAIAPMRILAVYAAFRCLAVILPHVLVYTGHARQSMHYNIIALLVLPPLFIAGASVAGASGVAWAWLIGYPLLTAFTYLRYLRKSISLSMTQYLGSLGAALGATGVMTAAVLGVRAVLPEAVPSPLVLTILVATGALAYGGVVFALHRKRLAEMLRLLRSPDSAQEANGGTPARSAASANGGSPAGSTAPLSNGTAARAHPRSRERILLIAYHFPPDPAIGSLRWQKFARFAAERGWGLDVIMRDEASIPTPDPRRLADLPPDVRRIGVPDRPLWFERLETAAAHVVRRVIPRKQADESLPATAVGKPSSGRDFSRAYFSVVDYLQKRRWGRDAARAALALTRDDPSVTHRVVIGCGPPYSTYMAAQIVSRATGGRIPLVIDMRDPWSLSQRFPEHIASPVTVAFAKRTERSLVRDAALVVTNTDPVNEGTQRLYPARASRIISVPNGFDDDPLPPPAPRSRFVMAYAGTIYLNRDPRPLLRALSIVVRDLALTPDQFTLEFMGDVGNANGVPLARLIDEAGVRDFVRILAPRPRAEALEYLAGASMLVLLPQDSDMVIPGKLYEYMRFEAWVLALAEPSSAVARLLRGSAAHVVSAGDAPAIASVLERCYRQHLAGGRGTPLAIDERLGRRARAERFFDALDDVLRRPHRQDPAKALEQRRQWVAPAADLGAVAAERHS